VPLGTKGVMTVAAGAARPLLRSDCNTVMLHLGQGSPDNGAVDLKKGRT
jgi:hypothetical protein